MSESGDSASDDQLEEEFAELLRHIWMAVIRATRSMEHLPKLPSQHVDVLRLLQPGDGMTPAQLATALRLSRSTVSELIRKMGEDGLIERVPLQSDGRSVRLTPTDAARRVLDAFGHGVHETVAAGLGRLPARERRRLLSDVEILSHLREELVTAADAAESESA